MARPRSFDEDKVLEGAVTLFHEKGYEGTSVPELSRRLGICRQSLYQAFGDKRGLYLKALQRWGEREVEPRLRLLASEGSALENVRTVIRGFAAKAPENAKSCSQLSSLVCCEYAQLRIFSVRYPNPTRPRRPSGYDGISSTGSNAQA